MSELQRLISKHQNPVGPSFLVLLAWLSQCDGTIDEKERKLLQETAGALLKKPEHVSAFFRITKKGNMEDLKLACENIRAFVLQEHRGPIFELAVAMAMADGVFSVGENHLIRFLADLLSRSEQEQDVSFRQVTGRPLPKPSDISSADWWEAKDAARKQNQGKAKQQRKKASQRSGPNAGSGSKKPPPKTWTSSERRDALNRLGVDAEATREEIKAAYKRLAKVHHPDRFHDLDEEIVNAATLSFRRIREAYELLMR
jgi:DnaJ like chaperone protein